VVAVGGLGLLVADARADGSPVLVLLLLDLVLLVSALPLASGRTAGTSATALVAGLAALLVVDLLLLLGAVTDASVGVQAGATLLLAALLVVVAALCPGVENPGPGRGGPARSGRRARRSRRDGCCCWAQAWSVPRCCSCSACWG
jgi:hypothetical protein